MGDLTMEKYLKHLKYRYKKASRKDKTRILDEFCTTSGLDRKHVIKKLRKPLIRLKERPSGRQKKYLPAEILNPLKEIWFASNQMCGERLHAAIPFWLPFYEKRFGFLHPEIKMKILSMSKSTIDRLLQPLRVTYPKRLCGTKPGTLLKKHIPIKTNQWDESMPGFIEADTVAHCGTSLMGSFVWSITLTDIYSGWTENAAVWNKGATGVLTHIQLIESRLPFKILGFDCDNGSEFLNHHLLRYLGEKKNPVQFTRSRPYHKGDNAHVEQKNWTHVRQIFGYYRFDNKDVVNLMNDLYRNELSKLHNFFYPAMKLKDKVRDGAKIKKCYDKPQTPYQRILASPDVEEWQKDQLRKTMRMLDPFQLSETIDRKLKEIFYYMGINLKKKAV